MHFRLGDYKKLSDYHPILPFDYYLKAMNHIEDIDIEHEIGRAHV